MIQRGYANIVFLSVAVFVLVVAGSAGYLAFKRQKAGQAPVKIEQSPETSKPEQDKIDISGWKTYRNEKYGFEVRYPNDERLITDRKAAENVGWVFGHGGLACEDSSIVCFAYSGNLFPNTNFNGVIFSVNIAEDVDRDGVVSPVTTPQDCLNRFYNDTGEMKNINGVDFHRFAWRDGVTQHLGSFDIYTAFVKNNCYEIRIDTETAACDPEFCKAYMSDEMLRWLSGTFNQILSTFKFVESGQTSESTKKSVTSSDKFIVVSPQDGQTVLAGSKLVVKVLPVAGTEVQEIGMLSSLGLAVDEDPPFEITVSIPNDTIKDASLLITVLLKGQVQSVGVDRTIHIEAPAALEKIEIESGYKSSSGQVYISLPLATGGDRVQLYIFGNYADGVLRHIEESPKTLYRSSNSKVAIIDLSGLVKAIAPGSAYLSVEHGGIIVKVPVLVDQYEFRGDLDGDSDVDQDDVNIVAKALDSRSTSLRDVYDYYAPGDPRDLNSDGWINEYDLQAEKALCSRQNCLTY